MMILRNPNKLGTLINWKPTPTCPEFSCGIDFARIELLTCTVMLSIITRFVFVSQREILSHKTGNKRLGYGSL